ncbi:MAG: exodeoxyribonuclease VII large subunit [Planctomycetota bacterium]|nr:exodeoxyribonuclease VII large subunit [Planctomycetota bacterium]
MGLLPFDLPDTSSAKPEPMSVSEVSQLIVQALADAMPATVRIRGEISGFTVRNGHWFFSLRDPGSSIDGVMWASQARINRHQPEDGDQVLVTGRIGHWPKGGRTRLEARRLEPDGAGDLRAAFLRLCKELRELGWFADEVKRPLPAWPRRIAVVTSSKGAAVTDVVATARSRFPAASLLVVDVRVQGDAAAGEVAAAVERLDAAAVRLGIDAIMVTRGGGAAEDLEAFNDRRVAQAVFQARTPVVAAIGHESDTTIIELVADARASTPTHAVTILLPDREDVLERFEAFTHRLEQAVQRVIRARLDRLLPLGLRLVRATQVHHKQAQMRVRGLADRLAAARPDRQLRIQRSQVESLGERLGNAIQRDLGNRPRPKSIQATLHKATAEAVRRHRQRARGLERALMAVDPLAVLQRGYSLTTDEQGRTVRDATDVTPGDHLLTRVALGSIRSRVEAAEASGSDSDTVEP